MARKSIHLTEQSEQYVVDRTLQSETPNYSGNINTAFSVLAYLAQSEKPELTQDDWVELYNVYTGSDLTRIALPLNLARDLLDHYGATLPKDLPENCRPLLDLLGELTQAQQFAVIDAVRVFWASGE